MCASAWRADGEVWGENDDCESQVCNSLTKLCISQRLQGGEPCGDRQDCQSNVCVVGNFDGTRTDVCCASGRRVFLSAPINDYFCTQNIPDGAGCPAEDSDGNSLCVSGICLGGESVGSGVCAGTRGGVGEACGENDDCESQACNSLTKTCASARLQANEPCPQKIHMSKWKPNYPP